MVRLILAVLIVGVAVGWLATWLVRRARRRELRAMAFPPEWIGILEANVPLYRFLPEKMTEQLHGLIQVFLDEKEFEGCGGLEINDEIRVTIAGQACILLLNRTPTHFPALESIVVYPTAYHAKGVRQLGGGLEEEDEQVRLGESWTQGTVVLAWDSVKSGASVFNDGENVVLHEFAHQLDQEDGAADGAPILSASSRYASWAKVFVEEYESLQEDVKRHVRTVMDAYGATNPAEFFAVATETFFEKPRTLRKKHPELYAELQTYYRMDPAAWVDGSDSAGEEAERDGSTPAPDQSHKKLRNKKKLRRRQKRRQKARRI